MTTNFSRRTAIGGTLAAAGAVALSSTPAHAVTGLDYTKTPTETVLGHIEGTVDLDYGAGATYSRTLKAPIAFTYSEGVAARFSAANLLTGEQVAAFEPFYDGYDRPESFITYPDGHTATVTTSGMVISFNPETLKAVAYKRHTERPYQSVHGEMSNISIGSAAPNGGFKAYIGDYNSRISRFILPAGGGTGSESIWVSYGQPFGGGGSILSTAFHAGYLYVGVRGDHAGLYRIAESTLDEAAARGRALEVKDFESLTPATEHTQVAARNYYPHQLLITDSPVGPLLVARITGTQAVRIRINSIGAPGGPEVFGVPFALNQTATADSTSIITRQKHGDTWYLIRLDMGQENPRAQVIYVGISDTGTLVDQTPLVEVEGRAHAVTSFQGGVVLSPLGEGTPNFKDTSLAKPARVVTAFAPAKRTQLNRMIYVPALGVSRSMLAFAPKWIQDQRIGIIDHPHTAPAGNNTRIRLQASEGRPNHHSNQVESFGYRSSGRLTIGTYIGGGAQLINAYPYPGDSQTTNKVLAEANGDPKAARLVCQAPLSDGNTLFGATAKFGSGAAGLSVFRARATASRYAKITSYPDTAVIPNQNITALLVLAGDKADTVLAGGCARLENGAVGAGRDPEHDATIALLPYDKAKGTLGAVQKHIKLPVGIKAVWSITRHSSGRIFVLAQYGDQVKIQDTAGKLVPDANVVLELDPKTFEMLPVGPIGQGVFVYTTPRTRFSSYGDIKETPTGQLLVRTNVFIHLMNLEARGVSMVTRLPFTGTTSFDIGADGEVYTANFDGYIRRFNFS